MSLLYHLKKNRERRISIFIRVLAISLDRHKAPPTALKKFRNWGTELRSAPGVEAGGAGKDIDKSASGNFQSACYRREAAIGRGATMVSECSQYKNPAMGMP
jgi:hypothetical protein